jgi:hypothetical protein
MKSNMQRVGVAFALIALLVLFTLWQIAKPHVYMEDNYKKDYVWNGIEVGTIRRMPADIPIPAGRHYAIIAITNGQPENARLLLRNSPLNCHRVPNSFPARARM